MRFEASRPYMPGYGIVGPGERQGLLPWSWAEQRLSDSHNYWLSTVTKEGRPHTMAVWGVWTFDSFVFSAGEASRKARNLEAEPRCTVTGENPAEAVVVEGSATLLVDSSMLEAAVGLYSAKYGSGYPPDSNVYRVVPEVVFGLIETSPEFTGAATRWRAVL